jgi:ankyrin repeat protein
MEVEASVLAKRTLSWLLCARRQLLSSELLAAVSPHPEELVSGDELLDICRHLIVLNELSDSFELAHLSVREYLETREEYKDGRPHALVAERCIKLFEPDVPRGVLDQYASLYWPNHYDSRPQMEGGALTDIMKQFFRDKGANPAFENWAKVAEHSSQELPRSNDVARRLRDAEYKPLSTVCVFGWPEPLDQWLNPAPESSYWQHSNMVVQSAIKWGNTEVVRLLLKNDAQPSMDKFGWTAWTWAAIYKQIPVLESLKELYGNVDTEDKVGWRALHWMVFLHHVEGLKALLSVGGVADMKDNAKWTPLHWAAFLGRETEAKELVERGHRLDVKDDNELTPFQWAKVVGQEATAKHLWTRGADETFSTNLSSDVSRELVRID